MSHACRRIAWTLLLLLLSLLAVLGQQPNRRKRWTPAEFPNPQKDVYDCGRQGVPSSICDPENILSHREQDRIDGLANEISSGTEPYKKAQCDDVGLKGFQVAVAVFHHMEHRKHADKAAAAQHFARALHDAWAVGNPACQNGALVLLAVSDRQVYISTGAGIKAVVSDAQLSTILDNIKPSLKHQRYGEALLVAVHQLGLLMSGQQPEPGGGVDSDDGRSIFMFFCASVAAVFGWAWYSNRKQHTRFKTCADKLAAIKKDQAAIRSRRYASTSCPICLEDFDEPVTASGAAAAARAAAAAGVAAEAVGAAVAGTSRPGEAGRAAAGTSSAAAAGTSAAGQEDEEESPSAPLLSSGSGAAGAAAGASSSNDGRGRRKKAHGRKPLVLRCGHSFCDPCITQWLKSNTKCPICRKDLDAADDPPATTNRRPDSPQTGSCRAAPAHAGAADDVWRRQVWLPELGFRLRRLRLMYPDFVTDPMVYAWEDDLTADRDIDTGMVQIFNPARQQQLEQRGHFGASSTSFFEGGSSQGGGGAGASW